MLAVPRSQPATIGIGDRWVVAAERERRLAAAARSFAVQARKLGANPEQALRHARARPGGSHPQGG